MNYQAGATKAYTRFGLKQSELTKIMPSAPPALIRDNAGAQPVSSEAAKNLAEREGDRRTDVRGAAGGYVLEGAKIAAAMYGVKLADALARAVQRGAVTPTIENADRLRAQMRKPMTTAAAQKTLEGFSLPGAKQQDLRVKKLRDGLAAAGPRDASNSASDARRSQILEKSFEPAMKLHGAVKSPMGGTYMMPNTARRMTTMSTSDTLSPFQAIALEHLSQHGHNITRKTLKRPTLLPGGTIHVSEPAVLAPLISPRAALEHEVGERWHHNQSMRGKPSTPYSSHLGPEATVREWGFAAQDDDAWRKAQALRAPFRVLRSSYPPSQEQTGDHLFARAYRQVGGTQNAPVPFDSRQSRAIARHYDRAYSKGHPALREDVDNKGIALARQGTPLSPGIEKAVTQRLLKNTGLDALPDATQLQHDWANRLKMSLP